MRDQCSLAQQKLRRLESKALRQREAPDSSQWERLAAYEATLSGYDSEDHDNLQDGLTDGMQVVRMRF